MTRTLRIALKPDAPPTDIAQALTKALANRSAND